MNINTLQNSRPTIRLMKRLGIIVLLFILTFCLLMALPGRKKKPVPEKSLVSSRNGVAVILTGAAARIPQEAALLEELDRRGLLKNLVFISGVSSGALNSVMLNGILSHKITWEQYREILYNLKNSDIFIREKGKIPVNTAPARELYKKIFEDRLGYKTIGDLPVPTAISFTHLHDMDMRKTVYRMCSRKINPESDTTLSLVDIVMASSAFPLVFPPVRIPDVTTIPDEEYVDGGIGEDHVPYKALLEFEQYRGEGVAKVYIVSRKNDSIPEVSEELQGLGINDKGLFDKLGFSIDAILAKGILRHLEDYAEDAPKLLPITDVWIPGFKEDFLLFNFDNLKEQYEITSQWARSNDPMSLGDYLVPHLLKK
jgi:predicted acylesterase/phospholipase RssA